MTLIRRRPRAALVVGILVYLLAGFTVSDVQSLESPGRDPGDCPAPLLRGASGAGYGRDPESAGSRGITILQGNAWMLPSRPLLLPYAFSVDRQERLERLVHVIRACRPDVVVLQEIFEASMVQILARTLPDYRTLASGRTDVTGTVNASGLVTLTRLPVRGIDFVEFDRLPMRAKAIERLGRKGLLAVDLDAPGFRGTIVNVHLYAARDTTEARLTMAQFGQVMEFAAARESEGWAPVLVGDFNLEPGEAGPLLPPAWVVSQHAPTYEPSGNRYTVQGSNNTPENHDQRRLGLGSRTVDWLVNSAPGRLKAVSQVLDGVELSDHYFVQHVLLPQGE